MKRFLAGTLIAVGLAFSPVKPTQAATVPYTQLADCAGYSCIAIDRNNVLHPVIAKPINASEQLFSGKLAKFDNNVYILSNSARSIKVVIK
jgi:hypothetical protein